MTTEADQRPNITETAAAMEATAAEYEIAKRVLAAAKHDERLFMLRANNARRAFNDAVIAMKQKRPKKAAAPVAA